MIKNLEKTDIKGLNKLPPLEWKFDYEDFLYSFIDDDFFYAFTLSINNKIIGTGNVLLKGKIGWLANIIVDEAYRGNGFGYQITTFLVDFLKAKGCQTQLLIATTLGEPVYQKIGFRKITEYRCFDTEKGYGFNTSPAIQKLRTADLDSLCQLDYQANGEDRRHLLLKYYQSGFGYFKPDNELAGCFLPDFGRGLVLATDEQVGVELLNLKHSKKGRRTLLPIDNRAGVNFFKQMGLKEGAKCSRMILGKENGWNPTSIYSYGSGYCG